MTIQDIIFSVGQILMAVAMLPSVLGKDKPAISTSLLFGLVLTVFGATYISLNLWFAAISAWAIAALWFVLVVQKYRQNKQ